MMDDEYYNPFDDENISRKRKWFTLVIAFIIASCIAFYVVNTYDVFPDESDDEELTGELEWHVIPYRVNGNTSVNASIPFDMVVITRFNATAYID